jgi:hypothetical protein
VCTHTAAPAPAARKTQKKMTTIAEVVRRTLASPKAQEQLLRMALLVLIWLWAFSIRLVRVSFV